MVSVSGTLLESDTADLTWTTPPVGTTSVEFFDGITSLGTSAVAPFGVTTPALTPGSHAFSAVAAPSGSRASATVSVTPNTPVLTSPSSSTVTIGSAVSLVATAAVDANTTKVEFYYSISGVETLIATDSSSVGGWTGSWDTTGRSAGVYSVFARRYTAAGTNDSASATITLSAATARHLRVQTKLASETFTYPTDFKSRTAATANAIDVYTYGTGGGGTTAVGSGGGGAFAYSHVTGKTPSATETLTVAAGAVNADGGDTSWGTDVIAKGGKSGTNGSAGGTAAASTGTTKYDGGSGTAGAGTLPGGGSAGSGGAGSGTTSGIVDGAAGSNGTAAMSAGGGSTAASQLAGGAGRIVAHWTEPNTSGYSYIVDFTWGRDEADATTRNITLPSGSGGKILVFAGTDGGSGSTLGLAGYTAGTQENSTTVTGANIFYINSTGSEAVALTTSATNQTAWFAFRVKSSTDGNPTTIDAASANGNSTNANPPNVAVTGGPVNALLFAFAAWDSSTVNAGPSAFPTGYTNHMIIPAANNNAVSIAICWRQANVTAEDPAVFTSVTEQWAAFTVAVSPT